MYVQKQKKYDLAEKYYLMAIEKMILRRCII